MEVHGLVKKIKQQFFMINLGEKCVTKCSFVVVENGNNHLIATADDLSPEGARRAFHAFLEAMNVQTDYKVIGGGRLRIDVAAKTIVVESSPETFGGFDRELVEKILHTYHTKYKIIFAGNGNVLPPPRIYST